MQTISKHQKKCLYYIWSHIVLKLKGYFAEDCLLWLHTEHLTGQFSSLITDIDLEPKRQYCHPKEGCLIPLGCLIDRGTDVLQVHPLCFWLGQWAVAHEGQLRQASQWQPVAQRDGVPRWQQRAHAQDRLPHGHATLQWSPQPGPQRYFLSSTLFRIHYHTS